MIFWFLMENSLTSVLKHSGSWFCSEDPEISKRFLQMIFSHTVREWIYNRHKLPRTFDCFLSLYNIHAYKKSLQKLIWTKKKNQLPERGIEPATLQISQKQGKFDLNAITTWPRRPLLKGAWNLNIAQYSTKFH